jgi:hypothetical protein
MMGYLGVTLRMTTAVLLLVSSFAFVPFNHHTSTAATRTSTQLYDVFAKVPRKDDSGLSYAERSRPYRRDVFAYDDWIKHRSSDRFAGRFIKFAQSGIVRALIDELILVTGVATFIVFFNAMFANGFDDLAGVHHDPLLALGIPALSLPTLFFTLSSPALSLLLGELFLDLLACSLWYSD